jgi:hypothetical protein
MIKSKTEELKTKVCKPQEAILHLTPKKKKKGFGIVMMVVDSVLQLEVWAATAYTGGVCFGK